MLRRVVECFAKDMTAKDTAIATKLSEPSIEAIFHRLREQMRDHGMFAFQNNPDEPQPARFVFNRKHRGVPEKDHPLHAIELIHRVLSAQNLKGFEELSASNPAHVKRATRLHGIRQNGMRRYAVLEKLKPKVEQTEGETRPFAPLDFEEDSTILINERKLDPHMAFFRYLWGLLLRHPI